VVFGGDFCTVEDSSRYFGIRTTWCEHGCCNNGCCDFILSAGFIGLIVICSIVGISIIITVICCCVKSQGSKGTVVHPVRQPANGVTVVNANSAQYSNSNTAWGQPGPYGPPPYQSGPPGYTQQYGFTPGQPAPPPPAYSDPAYPPGQSNASPFAAAANKS
ncbi:hypothetical protein BaRGS_00025121, partial [Batillaria attramentaria]